MNVLIAEDHELTARLIANSLSDLNNIDIVGIARNGKEAVSSIENYSIDIILMDINMPLMDGIQATKIIREKRPDIKFSALNHFFGYEGRCAAPSNFDADYGYSLGFTAAVLLANRFTGYMASLTNLSSITENWQPIGVPLVSMMNMEKRHGAMKAVIRKALVDLGGKPMKKLKTNRHDWELNSSYIFPGPIQYFGPSKVCDPPTITLTLEQK